MPSTQTSAATAAARLTQLTYIGTGLHRPECVLCTQAGHRYSADWRGGVAHALPDGSQRLYLGQISPGQPLRPNGIALCADGSFLVAHLGDTDGGVFRLTRRGEVSPLVTSVNGQPLPPTNFVMLDHQGRTWITVSTRLSPRSRGYHAQCNDGFIVLVDDNGPRIVADGLGYTNECAIDAAGRYLYVNETFARRLSRFELNADGSLGERRVITEFGFGTFPDGLALDEAGDLWVTSVVSNRLIRVSPDGSQTIWLEDADPIHVERVEQAWQQSTMTGEHLASVGSSRLQNLSSLAFGGVDRRNGYLGCLLGDAIAMIRMPVAGLAPAHWHHDD